MKLTEDRGRRYRLTKEAEREYRPNGQVLITKQRYEEIENLCASKNCDHMDAAVCADFEIERDGDHAQHVEDYHLDQARRWNEACRRAFVAYHDQTFRNEED